MDDVLLGHVRLAIQDLSDASSQPFLYEDLNLTYVGEMYNADELRDWLSSEYGCAFVTSGDTEVMAALLRWEGGRGLRRVEGFFALAWELGGDVYLARDHLGRAPLYYSPGGGLFHGTWWASERKALPGLLRSSALAVPPGFYLDARTGVMTRFAAPDREDGETAGSLEDLLKDAVERRVRSADVPICTLLSGGLDSSLIAAMIAKLRPDVIAYVTTIDPDGPDVVAARDVAAHIGVELREVVVPLPSLDDVRAAVHTVEIPVPSAVETAVLQRALAARIRADGFRVAFSGEVADEAFGGYGPMKRFASNDETWRAAKGRWFEKMGRADFIRANKSMMSSGVEPRCPIADLTVTGYALTRGLKENPPGKTRLREVGAEYLPESVAWREKASWHKAQGGMREHLEEITGGSRVKTYNGMVREEFGALVRG